LRITQNTAQSSGFHKANNTMDTFAKDTADVFSNLATETASGHQMLADLTATNTVLSQQLANKDTNITQLKTKIFQDLQCINQKPCQGGQGGDTRKFDNSNYCWTHGYDIANNHTS
jgi:hypothetical protein